MKILMICGLFPPHKKEYYQRNGNDGLQAAAISWQWNIINGLEENLGIKIDLLTRLSFHLSQKDTHFFIIEGIHGIVMKEIEI
ncbi:MAG: hypothetical protein ACOX0W_02160 [Sphaerochaetaceae bacterium]